MSLVQMVVRRSAIKRNQGGVANDPCIEIWREHDVIYARDVHFRHGRLRQNFLIAQPHGAQVWLEVEEGDYEVVD